MRRLTWGLLLALALLLTALVAAPAEWLTARLASASGGRLLAYETTGPWWAGRTRLALADPGNPRAAPMLLPGQVAWRIAGLSLSPLALRLAVTAPGLSSAPLGVQVSPAVSGVTVALSGWQARLPLGLLEGFGAPWNTLGLTGTLLWQHEELILESSTSATNLKGRGTLQILSAESSVSPVRPLGTYRVDWTGDERGLQFRLHTDSGPLVLEGDGAVAGGRLRFTGTAKAAPGYEEALASLLSIIGRREGDVMRLRVSS
ncbi:MAG: type II secretion system protein N [Betaproteobacteria bacterium]|nr:type II secretion system protein N [Betaproteobacteria bacterium]